MDGVLGPFKREREREREREVAAFLFFLFLSPKPLHSLKQQKFSSSKIDLLEKYNNRFSSWFPLSSKVAFHHPRPKEKILDVVEYLTLKLIR